MEVWRKYEGMKVFVILKSGREYSGKVKEIVDAGNGLVFISIIDKKNHFVTFSSGEIKVIQEEE